MLTIHPVIQEAYSGVHRWLETRDDTAEYMESYGSCRKTSSMKDIAAQFARYFPTHHFKTVRVLNETKTQKKMVAWLHQTPFIAIIDMGCGGGAASSALIALLLQLQSDRTLPENLHLSCIGVDPAANALGIYNQLLNRIKEATSLSSMMEIKVVDRPVSESVTDLDYHLNTSLQCWGQPALSHVFLLQSNIVSPLGALYEDQQERRKILADLGIPTEAYVEEPSFGNREARSYLQLLRQLPIDNLHVVTVATDQSNLEERVEAMGTSIEQVFAGHTIHSIGSGTSELCFKNPVDSFWRETRGRDAPDPKQFHFDVRTVENSGLLGDTHWQDVISIDNLELAWARVRLIRTRDAINDEIEIRLFERDLQTNLERLHSKLNSYETKLAKTDDRLSYSFPKGDDDKRPYVLPRLEEDIVAVATVQVLGKLAFGLQNTSYAYRPHESYPRSTEFLYRYWFDAYRRFRDDVLIGVSNEGNCDILKTDIESYYPNINQRLLVDTVASELRTHSARVKWLLEKLFLVDLHFHQDGHGLAQGAVGSGFYANTFLAPLDSTFGVSDNRFYRYVDDIYLLIPEDNELQDVKKQLDTELNSIGLKRNCGKTKSFDSQAFREYWVTGDKLDDISHRFTRLTNCLWYANNDYRSEFQRDETWWDGIGSYRQHLRSIKIFVEPDRLSRKVHQYFSRRKRRNDSRSGLVEELKYPPLQSTEWTYQFELDNSCWVVERDSIRKELISKLSSSFKELPNAVCEKQTKELTTNIVFCANRLPRLGLTGIVDLLTEILTDQPSIIRQPGNLLCSLADQGFSEAVCGLMNHYASSDFSAAPYYLALSIESIRHLKEINENTIQEILNLAVDKSQPSTVRLKATETLVWTSNTDVDIHVERIRKILLEESSPRMRKNYKLLLGDNVQHILDTEATGDHLLESVNRLIREGNVRKLFDYVEPDILRKRYYGWEYPDDSREYTEYAYY